MQSSRSIKEKAFWNIAAFILRTLLTFVVIFILLVQANGYVINFHTLSLTRIGLLFIHPNPVDVEANLNTGEIVKQSQDLVAQLLPGQYALTLTKPNYKPWKQTVNIQAGRSSAYPYATLYLEQPILVENRLVTLSELSTPLIDPKLKVMGSELWRTNKESDVLVTRYISSIRSARLFDSGHVLVQLDSEIHIIDIDGSNDQVLLTLGDAHQRRILPIDGKTIGLLDVDQVTTYRIR